MDHPRGERIRGTQTGGRKRRAGAKEADAGHAVWGKSNEHVKRKQIPQMWGRKHHSLAPKSKRIRPNWSRGPNRTPSLQCYTASPHNLYWLDLSPPHLLFCKREDEWIPTWWTRSVVRFSRPPQSPTVTDAFPGRAAGFRGCWVIQ